MAKKTSRRSSTPAKRGPGRPRGGAAAKGRSTNSLAGRLRDAAGPLTFREVGEMTGTHPENARRYLQGGSVGLKFFKNFCKAFNISADWLLEGIGPRERRR
jgi:hypothetical protein